MRTITFLLALTIITSCNNSGGVKMPVPQAPDVSKEFHPFLKGGSYEVEYYSNKEVTFKQKQLLKKLSKIIESNSRTQKYFRQIEEGGNPAYNSNIGISKQEHNQLTEFFSYRETEQLNGTLNILREGKYIRFQGRGRLSLLDSLKINSDNKSATFKQYNMGLDKDSIDLSGENIPKGDIIEFYEFYKGPDGISGLTGLDGIYELLICKLKPSNRIYLSFFARQPDKINHPIPEFVTVIIDNLKINPGVFDITALAFALQILQYFQ